MLCNRRHCGSTSAAVLAFAAGAAGFDGNASASLTIDLRLPDGSKSVGIGPDGKVLVDIWAIVDGTSTDLVSAYGIQFVAGSIVSQGDVKVNVAGAKGDLDMYRKTPQQTTALRPFARSGEQPGTQRDLDGDGDLDLGSPNQNDATGFIIVRSDPMEYPGLSNAVQAGPDGSSIEAKIGRVEATILSSGSTASLSWLPRRNAAGQIATEAGLWFDDSGGGPSLKTGQNGTILSGAPLVLVIPEPSTAGLVACAVFGLLRRRKRATT